MADSPRARLLFWILTALIFAAGIFVRLSYLDMPLLDFHPTRQLHSALIARGMYYEQLSAVDPAARDMAIKQWRTEGLIEPQVFERAVALSYQAAGGVFDWIPRLYSALFWVIGAVFLFLLMLEVTGKAGALVGSAFFLLWPYGVSASRAFQPDPLMVVLIIAGLWALVRWQRSPRWGWAVAAGALMGLAIYIKSTALFFVLPALAAVALFGPGLKRALRLPQVWSMGVLALLPYALYLLDGVVLHSYLVGQFGWRFFPEMWLDPAFYLRWIGELSHAVPFALCLAALAGALLPTRPVDRALLLSLWLGYLVFGMALPHHISTHDYYSLPLLPMTSLGLAAIAQPALTALKSPAWLSRSLAAGALLAAVLITGYQDRTMLKRSEAFQQAQVWQAAARFTGSNAGVVILSDDYGMGLEYWGWMVPTVWPSQADIDFRAEVGQSEAFQARFDQLAIGRDYFVISPLSELDLQPDLKAYLNAHYALVHSGLDFTVYDLRRTK